MIVILAIVASMAIPRFGASLARQRADAAARRIMADLDLARRHANQTSSTVTVFFDVAQNRYWLSGVPDPDRPGTDYAVELDAEPYLATIVSADFGGTLKVGFDGYGDVIGAAKSGGKVVISVGPEQRVITLDANTGRATWE